MTQVSPKHRKRSLAEATQDAIFVFQLRRVNAVREPAGYWYDDGLLYELDAAGCPVDPGLDTDAQLALQASGKVDPFIVEWWETERVFLDRDEAVEWERANAHNYSGRRRAWRVYSVPATGQLARLLRMQDAVAQPSSTTENRPAEALAQGAALSRGE